jgi:hypothetical protein
MLRGIADHFGSGVEAASPHLHLHLGVGLEIPQAVAARPYAGEDVGDVAIDQVI